MPHLFALLNKSPYNQQELTNYSLDPHPTKTEYMLLSRRGLLTGPKQAIKMGDYVIEEIVSTRCLGVLIDNALKCDLHVSELAKSFTQKLNLLIINHCTSCLDRRELISILGLFCPLLRMEC